MEAGRLDRRATFLRRAKVAAVPGKLPDSRAGFETLFTVAAEYRPLSGRALAEAGSLTDAIEGTLIVRYTARTRKLTVADRVVVEGREMAIESVPPSDRSGWLSIKVSRKKASA